MVYHLSMYRFTCHLLGTVVSYSRLLACRMAGDGGGNAVKWRRACSVPYYLYHSNHSNVIYM